MGKPTKKRKPNRASLLFYLLLTALLAIFLRLVFIQAVEAEKFDRLALEQRLRHYKLAADRGTIYDRRGEVLALSTDMDTVFATPYQVKNKRRAAKKIAAILGESTDTVYERLSQKSGFVYLGRKIEKDKADKLRALKIEGLGFVKESKRLYPGGSLAAHALGFVGLDNNGLAGLELYYDKYLKGRPGRVISEQDPLDRPIPGGIYKFVPATNGSQIVTTLDKEIQYKAEVELKVAIDAYKAKGGSIIVMNPKNGDIYALANYPTFDLNDFTNVQEEEVLRNKAVTDVYEPGSTMKIVTAAGALEERLFSPDSRFTLPGTISIGGWLIHEAHQRGTEDFTFSTIVTRSSNIGAVMIGQKLGKERLYEYIERFGLNRPTGIDLPGESQGFVLPPAEWSASSIGNIPFGQGMSATPLGMIQVLGTIANQGRSEQPRLVSLVILPGGKEREIKGKNENQRQVISPETAAKMVKILEEAVDTGTGQSAKVPGYSVAGKTGTAQKPNIGKPGYSGQFIASFGGFIPARDPELAILVIIDEPQSEIYGGVVAAPVFSKVAEFSVQRLKILPDKNESN